MLITARRRAFNQITVIVCAATLLLGCLSATPAGASTSRGSTLPVTVHATNGVKIRTRPTAIVSLSPTATEMLYAIGAGRQVKAVDSYSDYPAHTPMTKLNGDNPNVEAIAAYKPDLVIVSSEEPGLNAQFKALGVPLIYLPAAANLNQEYAQFAQLGKATGHAVKAASEEASIRAQIAQIVHSVHKQAHHPAYYYELDQTYYSVTSSTFVGQVLGLLGLRSIADSANGAASSGGYPQLSGEFILKSKPNYIFLADTLCCGQSIATVGKRAGWSDLPAVKDGRVLALNDDIASRWGPRIVILLREVAHELNTHPVKQAGAAH